MQRSDAALILVTIVSSATLLSLAALLRVLAVECLDPGFLRAEGRAGAWAHIGFLLLLVLNLAAAGHAITAVSDGQAALDKATIVVALGGDGFMLQVLHFI
mgnify:CR=1 FL=1